MARLRANANLMRGVIAALTVAVYAQTLGFGFVFDDANWVPLRSSALPLSMFPFLLASWLGDGQAWAFHLFVLALHLLNGGLLWTLARRWLSPTASLAAVSLFWLHPLATEAVAYVSGGREVLLTTYVLVAALGLLAGGWWVALGLGSFALAVSLKWSALPLLLVVPFIVPAIHNWGRLVLVSVPLSAAAAWWLVSPALSTLDGQTAFGATLAALWRSLAMVPWPAGLSVEHAPASELTGLIAIAGTVLAGLLAWQTRPTWYAWLWIVGLVLPRGLTADAPLAERHLYLPLVAVWLLAGSAFDSLTRKDLIIYG